MAAGLDLYRGGRVFSQGNGAMEPPPVVQFANAPACGASPVSLRSIDGLIGLPGDVAQWACWYIKGMRRSPTTGKLTSVALVTPEVVLPVAGSFKVGPDLFPSQAFGKFFPAEWASEAVGRGIYRIKVDFTARKIAGALPTPDIIESAKQLETRILQIGTEDRWTVALNLGDAQDAAKSTISPSEGGFWLPEGEEFIPWNPTLFAYDFAGEMIGGAGDQYAIRATIRSYFKQVVC